MGLGCFLCCKKPKYSTPRRIGVLQIDYDYPPVKGDVDHKESFEYDVIYEKIPGLTFDKAQKGLWSDDIAYETHIALRRLEKAGCIGITGDCGFMMAYQIRIRRMTSLPVFMSSLLQAPIAAASFQADEKIAILTANSKTLYSSLTSLLTTCGINVDPSRFVVIGCEDVAGFEAVLKGEQMNYKVVSEGISKLLRRYCINDEKIKGVIMECTEMPVYSDMIRKETGMPVFDAITMIDYYYSTLSNNKKFGAKQWY